MVASAIDGRYDTIECSSAVPDLLPLSRSSNYVAGKPSLLSSTFCPLVKLASAVDVDRNTAVLAHQLQDFLFTGHKYKGLVASSTKEALYEVCRHHFRPASEPSARRAGSAVPGNQEDPQSWPADWVVDKTAFK